MLDQGTARPFEPFADVRLMETDGRTTIRSSQWVAFDFVDQAFFSRAFSHGGMPTKAVKARLSYLRRDYDRQEVMALLASQALTQAQLVQSLGAQEVKSVQPGQSIFIPFRVGEDWVYLAKLMRRSRISKGDLFLEKMTKSFQACDRPLFLFLATA